ncbi:MAG: peptidoglycan bridge formation glycyltransferase FemA/FemB family protein [Patescibacteria group bacterium]|nr:peptidoglycan bridge formation glycyltransferase FemA/FemB family protein [Patescibacteria group bacterium]
MISSHLARNEQSWDAFVMANGGGFHHAWDWARFQEAAGRQIYRFRIDEPSKDEGGEHEDTVIQFVAVIHALPLGFRYTYVPYGPVLRRGDAAENARRFETFVGALREFVAREHLLFARVDFPFRQSSTMVTEEVLAQHGFQPVKAVAPAATSIVDLVPTEEQLLSAMHPKTRYNIRVAERHGVVVREAAYGNAHLLQHDVELFWRLLSETAARDGFRTHPRSYYETMIDALSPKKRTNLTVRLVFAEHAGEVASAALVADYGDMVTYLHGASSSVKRPVMAPYALHWEIIREAKRRGFAKYDFWGVAATDAPDDPWAGITRFKLGFGGRRENYLGTWELPNGGVWYKLYRSVKNIRGRGRHGGASARQ